MLLSRLRIWCVLLAAVTKGAYSVSNPVPSIFCPASSASQEREAGKGEVVDRRSNHVACFLSQPFSGEPPSASSQTRTTFEVRMAATSALSTSRRLGKLGTSNTIFFACDIQERFRSIIHNMPAVISTARFLLDVSKVLDVPSIATEQYPKALLHTVPELNIGQGPEQNKVPVFEKKLFSMCTEEVWTHLDGLPSKPTDVVLFGIEAHVCITQTCLDLLERGYGVHVVCDGVSSQNPYDRTVGLQRMRQVGAFLTTAEQVAFQLAGTADHPSFKAMSALVKKRTQEGNAFSAMSSL